MSAPTPPPEVATKRRIPHQGREGGAGSSNASAASQDTAAFVASRIEAAQSALWRAELTRRILTIVIAALAGVFVWLVLDQWVYSAGPFGRTLITAGLIVAVIAYVYLRLWPVMHLRVSEDYAARALERDHPELGHALSSYISLRRQRAEHPQGQLAQRVVQSVGSGAAAKLQRIDAPPSEATGLATWWAATIALLAAVAIYTLASPKNSAQSVARLALPMSSLEAPKRVRIHDVSPGHAESLAGRSLDVAATVVNLRDDEPVYFRWETAQNRDRTSTNTSDSPTSLRDQVRLLPSDTAEGLNRFQASVPIPHHAHGTRGYRIVAGDAAAGPYQISIRDTPVVQIHEVVYDPPAYTGKPRHTSRTGALRGVDGTRVKLAATVNRPITRAVIEFNPRKVGRDVHATAGVREMEIAADGTNIEFTFPLRLRSGAAIALQDYRLRVWDDAGQSNADPIVYPIEIIEDLPPEVTIVVPQHSPVDVPINGQQIFEIHAADVDFGLAEIEIEIRRGLDLIARSSLWKEPAGKRGNHVVEYRFQPSRMIIAGRTGAATTRGSGLNVGDEVEVVAIATDNRLDPDDDTIAPGVTKTQPVRLKITAAVQPPSGEDQDQQGEGQQGEGQQGEGQQGEGQQGEGQQGEGQQGEGQQGEGQQGEGQQGEGQQGEGQQGEGQQGEGQQGEGQQGEGQQGERQQGEGQRGEGQQGEGQQGEGQQGEGQQGEGQQGEGQRGEMGGTNSDASEPTQNDSAGSGQDGSAGDTNDDASDAAGASPSDADNAEGQSPQENAGSRTGEGGGSPDGQSAQPPQDDAEAFERIQEYLKQNQPGETDSARGENRDQQTEPPQTATDESGQGESGQGESGNEPSPDGRPSDERSGQNQSGQGQSRDRQSGDAQGSDGENSDGENSDGLSSDGQRGGQAGEKQGDQGQAGDDQGSEQASGDQGAKPSRDDAEPMNGQGGEDQSSEQGNAPQNQMENTAGEPANQQPADGSDRGPEPGSNGDHEQAEASDEAAVSDPAGSSPDEGESSRGEGGESRGDSATQEGDEGEGESSQGEGGESRRDSATQEGDEGEGEASLGEGLSQGEGSESRGDSASPREDAGASDSPHGGGGVPSGIGADHAPEVDDELPDPVDLEYTKAATDMVLDYIDETRTDPDPDLLQRLKWSEQDLRRFRERWQNIKPIDGAPVPDATSTSEIEEALRSLGMRPRQTTQSNRRDAADDLGTLRDSGNRRPAPPDVRDAFEAFRRGFGQSSTRNDD